MRRDTSPAHASRHGRSSCAGRDPPGAGDQLTSRQPFTRLLDGPSAAVSRRPTQGVDKRSSSYSTGVLLRPRRGLERHQATPRKAADMASDPRRSPTLLGSLDVLAANAWATPVVARSTITTTTASGDFHQAISARRVSAPARAQPLERVFASDESPPSWP